MGGTWSLGTATWSLGTTTWSLVGTIIYMVAWTTIIVVDWFMVDASSHFDVWTNSRTSILRWFPMMYLFSFIPCRRLGMRNFLCSHSSLRRTSFSSTGNLQSQFLNDNIHSIIHHENLYLIRFQPPVRALLIFSSIKSFHHSTFMLSFRSEDWASSARISRCAPPRAGSRLYRSCVLPIAL